MRKKRLIIGAMIIVVGILFGLGRNAMMIRDEPSKEKKQTPNSADIAAASKENNAALSEREQAARLLASKSLEEQSPEVRRRYHTTWVATSERSRTLQAGLLKKLEHRLSELGGDEEQRQLINERIRSLKEKIAQNDQKLERHLAELRKLNP